MCSIFVSHFSLKTGYNPILWSRTVINWRYWTRYLIRWDHHLPSISLKTLLKPCFKGIWLEEFFERKYDICIAAMLANTHQSCSVIYLKAKVNIRHMDYIIDDQYKESIVFWPRWFNLRTLYWIFFTGSIVFISLPTRNYRIRYRVNVLINSNPEGRQLDYYYLDGLLSK